MSDQRTPSIILIHGAQCTSDLMQPFVTRLEAAGFPVYCPQLPTCSDKRPPTAGLQEDAEVVQAIAQKLKNDGHSVIIVAHSYGGMVATQAITPSLYASEPFSINSPGVVRLIYVSALFPLPGMRFGDLFTKYNFTSRLELGFDDEGTAVVKNAPYAFFNDLDPEEAKNATTKLVPFNRALVNQTLVDQSPWRQIPSTYVYCSQDISIPPEFGKTQVSHALALDPECGLQTMTIDAGHFPFLSKPDEMIEIVRRCASSASS